MEAFVIYAARNFDDGVYYGVSGARFVQRIRSDPRCPKWPFESVLPAAPKMSTLSSADFDIMYA